MFTVVIRSCAVFAITAATAFGAVLFSAAGATPADIQSTVDSFRANLGTLNPNTSGSASGGRREINWDGVPDAFAAPNSLPANFFNANSPRGVVISTPGTALQVSSSASTGQPVRFGNIDPSYTSQFQSFSPQRLFSAIGSNIVHVIFFVPGSNQPASVGGFGAVFTDVETATSTKFTVFLANGAAGGEYSVPVSSSGGISFLGVIEPNRISRVVIQMGNTAMGAGTDNPGAGRDIVAADDFIFGEPQSLGNLNVDVSTATKYDALTDGVIILRYLFGINGTAMTNGALGATATRTDPTLIKAALDATRQTLDIDGNGAVDALTDGLMIIRYLFGLRGDALIAGAIGPTPFRSTAAAIEPYIQMLMP